jgi:uncharacterized protein (TIGR02268 family)
MRAHAQTPAISRSASARPIELTAEPSSEAPEVFISPGKSTTLTFDSELLRTGGGGDTVELEKRESFALVDSGGTVLRLIPSDRLKPGDRVRMKVQFKERAAPSGAVFILVVRASEAERVVEVYRNVRSVESYQQETREARAETAQCRAALARTQAECAGPAGMRSLLAARHLDEGGVRPQDLTEGVTRAPGSALTVVLVRSYRATGLVAVELELTAPEGAQPFTVAGAALTGKRGEELMILPVWSSGPITANSGVPGRVAVEAVVTAGQVQGTFTLKLWEAGTGRTVIVGNVTFP